MCKTRNPDALIRIEDAIKVLCWATCCPGARCPDGYCAKVWDEFEDVERVDAVPVVRCAVCRYFRCNMRGNGTLPNGVCVLGRGGYDPMDFCSEGERKDGDHHD